MTCWICHRDIPDGEQSKDHLIPKRERETLGNESAWFWAHLICNNARGQISFLVVEDIQKLLDSKKPDWITNDIVVALHIRGRKFVTDSNEEIVNRIVYGDAVGQFFAKTNIHRHSANTVAQRQGTKPEPRPTKEVETYTTWKPVKLPNGDTVWTPNGKLPNENT